MNMEVMAIKASSEFGRLETASELAYGFDFGCPDSDFKLVTSRLGDDYDLTLYCRLGLYCYNFQKGTNFKFVRWEKYNTEFSCDLDYYITLEAMDPACNSVFPFQILFSEAGYTTADTYDIDTWRILACRPRCMLGLYCYNFQKGTNLKFVRWEKYNTEYTCDLDYYITLEAMDPACNSVFSFQILFSDAGYTTTDTFDIVTWRILACRPRCNKPVDDYWDRHEEMDEFYTSPMPKWFSDEALASDKKKYYVLQESELHENDWLHLFMEIACFSKTSSELVAPPPLEINKVVVETKEDYITEVREKLQAENAIFYISYKYGGVSSSGFAGDHKAIIRKTMDGKPEHMSLEVAYEPEEEE